MAGYLKTSNTTIRVFVDLFLWVFVVIFTCICIFVYMKKYIFSYIHMSICVPRGQLVGACSLVCRNQRLTQESWLLLTIGPADQAQAFRLSRKFLAASLASETGSQCVVQAGLEFTQIALELSSVPASDSMVPPHPEFCFVWGFYLLLILPLSLWALLPNHQLCYNPLTFNLLVHP